MTAPAPRDSALPETAAVAAVLAAAENAVAAYMVAAYTRWLAAVATAVLGGFLRFGITPDPGAIWSTVPLWERQVDELLDKLRLIARAGWINAGQQLGIDLRYNPDDPILVNQLLRTRNLLVRTPDEVYRQIIKALGDSVAAGETVENQVQRVRHVLDVTGTENWPARARTVAVTECLPGDAVIDGADVTAAYRRWYEGDWVTVTTKQGNRISGTPNHPVLTTRGWVGLGELLEQDRLLRDHLEIDDTLVPLDPDVQAEPATIAEIFDSVKAIGIVGRVAGGKPDFHGDGLDGDIDVLVADGPLGYGRFSHICEHRVQLSLEATALSEALLAAQSAPFSYLGTLEEFAGIAGGYLPASEDSGDGVPTATQLLCEVIHTATRDVLGDDVVGGYPVRDRRSVTTAADIGTLNPHLVEGLVDRIHAGSKATGDDGYRDPLPVFLDNVISVRTSHFAGHVYNLSTVHGYFVSDGFFVGNTHRAWNFGALAASMRAQMQLQIQLMKRWSARDDSAVRPGHKRADGQTVPVNQPFIVNMEALMAPGDPSGSPSNVINCRCKPIFSRGTR